MPLGHRRNLHIILEESFWDPTVLAGAGYSADPIDPRFRDLWGKSNLTRGLSPAFGGQTANAEFEVLCGFPVNQIAVKFEFGLLRDVPVPAADPAATSATAPSPRIPTSRASGTAIPPTSISASRPSGPRTHMDLTDSNGPFLADRSLHRQVREKLQATDDGRPVFDYIVTIDGHWMYDAGDERPPVLIAARRRSRKSAITPTCCITRRGR